ncbi:GcrA family cell cycle regulator [Sinorhizobium sp. NFACC03]|uniref:GcrA family cell cycle regulator n=1 Tax=Sinorhizobium sp. NFACC03 TaxID=1566295 RepID=UPI000B8050ED|nr:GcrA family cell cycle regulator [Sinorhizobium sp. NFACC03]
MSETKNTWSDDRIERLTQLWSEGLSASQIAHELGGVTRNAVIGKVHRLGLPGRAKTSIKSVRKEARAVDQAPAPARPRTIRASVVGNTALVIAAGEIVEQPLLASTPEPSHVIPITGRLTLMELGPSTCRWPMGDPRSADFRFCGARIAPGTNYCSAHACLAHQPRSSGPPGLGASRFQSPFLRKST